MVNKVTLVGRLGQDPEVRRLESGIAVARLNLATNESIKDKNSGEWKDLTEWHRVVCWRNMAERAEKQLKKGSLVYLEGKISTRKWTDKDGKDNYTTEVVANYMRNLTPRDSQGGGGSFPSAADAPQQYTSDSKPSNVQPMDDAADDDLPF